MDTATLFFEFEEVLVVAGVFMLTLIYLFYFKYPYDKDLD
jgi:hypothetical protein